MLEGGGARSSAGVSWMPNKAYGCFWSYGASVACFGYDHPAGARAVHDNPISPRRYFACWSNSQSIQHLWLSLPVLSRPTVITIISQFPHVPILPFLLSDRPPSASTSALFHFCQQPVQRKRSTNGCDDKARATVEEDFFFLYSL